MLEIRNLTKIYRSKTGESVKALDNVSISFPESGMVFILGKSGSGKSTLLNIMGGLDSYDSGEFIIKGKSSKDFGGSDFDAYRNTFIGFIFQEYNVLDDFTVGANIALALELQGKKATPERINEILSQVDLLNYAKRKPNELSGGQKQRVAIARALVKSPQIIMADEPTGALDSNTGKQIFDSLKLLSKEKLVLIVSHDRDFAERYADRIVELSDGRIISDVTKHERESERISDGIDKLSGQILRIKRGYRLTERDLQMINEYLARNDQADVLLSGDGRVNEELRSVAGISDQGTVSVFEGTDEEKDVCLKKYEKKDSHFIRSRLPVKNALRMGASGLRHKKFRLTMTVLLSTIAFALFGFADSMAAYQKITSATDSLMDSNVKNASISLGVKRTVTYSDGEVDVYFTDALLNEQDLAYLREKVGLDFVPVFTGGSGDWYYGSGWSVTPMMKSYVTSAVYTGKIHGLVAFDAEQVADVGFGLVGRMPQKKGEIVITDLMYRQFNEFGFVNSEYNESVAAGTLVKDTASPNSIIGKHLTLSVDMTIPDSVGYSFEIVGVLDTGFDYTRYERFLPEDENTPPVQEENNFLEETVLQMELASELNYGFHALGYTTTEDINLVAEMRPAGMTESVGTYFNSWDSIYYISVTNPSSESDGGGNGMDIYGNRINQAAGSSALSKLDIHWFDGVERTTLAADEVVLPSSMIEALYPTSVELTLDLDRMKNDAIDAGMFDESNWNEVGSQDSAWEQFRRAAMLGYIDQMLEQQEVVDAVCAYALDRDYDEHIQDRETARQFWKEFWLDWGMYDVPVADQAGFKTVDQLERSVRELFASSVGQMLGLDSSLQDSDEFLWRVEEWVRYLSVAEPKLTVESWSIRELLLQAAVERDLDALLSNDAFVEMMLKSNLFSSESFDWEAATPEERRTHTMQFYRIYLSDGNGGYNKNPYGSVCGKDLEREAKTALLAACGKTEAELLSSIVIERFEENGELQHSTSLGVYDFKIVGVYDSQTYHYGNLIISDTALADYEAWELENRGEWYYTEEIAEHEDGIWSYALAPMGRDVDVIRQLVEMSYDNSQDLKFALRNPVMDTLESFNSFIEVGAKIFLYVGIGFAVFSALLLMNFIAISISYKKREIGVLRAVGARSSDVFKIFFSEALMIAVINFLFSTALVVAGIIVANNLMHQNGIAITLLHYGVRQFALMLLISVVVALLASYLPVSNIARKKPVDAIKDR